MSRTFKGKTGPGELIINPLSVFLSFYSHPWDEVSGTHLHVILDKMSAVKCYRNQEVLPYLTPNHVNTKNDTNTKLVNLCPNLSTKMKELNNDFIIFFDRNQTSGKLIDRVKNTFYIYFMIMNKRLFSVINEYLYQHLTRIRLFLR